MKETALWDKLRPELAKLGKFQKIADKFTGGIPDVLGNHQGHGIAIELKEFKGTAANYWVRYRPGQVRWLRDWQEAGGTSWVASTVGTEVYLIPVQHIAKLADGVNLPDLVKISSYIKGEEQWEHVALAIVRKSTLTYRGQPRSSM